MMVTCRSARTHPSIPQPFGDADAVQRYHAETVCEHFVGDRGRVLEKGDLVDGCGSVCFLLVGGRDMSRMERKGRCPEEGRREDSVCQQ